MKRLLGLFSSLFFASCILAEGHGPLFGLATPTNSKGEWSFDSGLFGRSNDFGSQASFRELPRAASARARMFARKSRGLRRRFPLQQSPALDFRLPLRSGLFRCVPSRPHPRPPGQPLKPHPRFSWGFAFLCPKSFPF